MTYIFDFDGTLVDSMTVMATNMEQMFVENNLPVAEDFVKIITPLGYAGVGEYARSLGLQMSVEEFVEKSLEKMIYSYHNVIQTKPHVVQGLQRLKEAGASLNILTASPHMILDKCLERLGLWEMFDNIWSSDDFGLKKSDPQIYREVAARLQKNVEDCIFVDDNIGAVTTAKKAGMYSVGVYDKFSEEYVEQMQAIADKYIFDFREL